MGYSEEQVRAAQQGDTAAFGALAAEFYTLTHGLAWSRTGDPHAADDVSQEAWLVAWANLGQLRHPGAFPVWLRHIVLSCAGNWMRNAAYRRKLADAMEGAPACSRGPDPAQAAEHRETRDRLCAAIMRLSPKLREAMAIRFLEECSILDGAAALGIREDAMRKRLRMGCAQVRAQWPEVPLGAPARVEHRKKAAAGRVLAALAAGPAVPDFGKSVAAVSKWGLTMRHMAGGGAISSLHGARLTATLFQMVAVVVVTATAAGASGMWVVPRIKDGTLTLHHDPRRGNPDWYEGSGILLNSVRDASRPGWQLKVKKVLEGYPAAKAGLKEGDLIYVPTVRGEAEMPAFRGRAGGHVRGAALRTLPDGSTTEFQFDITRDFVPSSFQKDNELGGFLRLLQLQSEQNGAGQKDKTSK